MGLSITTGLSNGTGLSSIGSSLILKQPIAGLGGDLGGGVTWDVAYSATLPFITYSNGNLTANFAGADSTDPNIRATVPIYPGQKKFFSVTMGQATSEPLYSLIGLGLPLYPADPGLNYLGTTDSVGAADGDHVYVSSSAAAPGTGTLWTLPAVVDVAVDLMIANQIWYRWNGGPWNGDLAGNPAAGTGGISLAPLAGYPLYPMVSGSEVSPASPNICTANFAGPFTYAAPSGFTVVSGGTPPPPIIDYVGVWKAAVITAGGTVSGVQETRITTLVNAIIAAGVWDGIDGMWLHASENTQQALIDLKKRVVATPVNAPVFTVNRGYKGNGTTQYIDTNYRAMVYSGNYRQDDASMGTWVVQAPTIAGVDVGNDDSAYSWIEPRSGSTTSGYAVNLMVAPAVTGIANAGVYVGQYHAQRTGPAAMALYKNGAVVDSQVATAASRQPPATLKALAASSDSGTVGKWSDSQVGLTYFGKSMTAPQITAFYNALRTYMTAVGVP